MLIIGILIEITNLIMNSRKDLYKTKVSVDSKGKVESKDYGMKIRCEQISYSKDLLVLILFYSLILEYLFQNLNISVLAVLSGLFYVEDSVISLYIYLISTIIILISKPKEMRGDSRPNYKKEFYIILKFSILGMILLLSSYDLISMFLSIELQSLSFYVLAVNGTNKKSDTKVSGGFTYYLIGSVSSTILLLGILLIYLNYSTTSMESLRITTSGQMVSSPGYQFIFVSLIVKLGASPFHNWILDVYESVSYKINIILTTVGKISIIIFISKWFVYSLIMIISSLSLVIGSLGGIIQYSLKRLIGYSSIANLGYILISYTGGSNLSKFYIIQYTLSLIIILTNIIYNVQNDKSKISLMIGLFSLIGIPPLIGFFGKVQIILNSIVNGNIIISLIIIMSSIISTSYYLRIMQKIVTVTDKGENYEGAKMSDRISWIISIITSIHLIFCLNPLFPI